MCVVYERRERVCLCMCKCERVRVCMSAGGQQFQIQTLTQNGLKNGPANSESLPNLETGNSF